jgi:GMP synthase-like glutamine amidotransferase
MTLHTFERDFERLENDWFELHGDRVKALAKSYKVLMSHPTLKNDLEGYIRECHTLAHDLVKDWMK